MAEGEHLRGCRDRLAEALDKGDGATIPVHNVLTSTQLYGLTKQYRCKCGLGGGTCAGAGRQRLGCCRRGRYLDSSDSDLTPVRDHEAATIHNFRDLAGAEYLETARAISVRDPDRRDE